MLGLLSHIRLWFFFFHGEETPGSIKFQRPMEATGEPAGIVSRRKNDATGKCCCVMRHR
ncbi:hypothetical protein RchiOBHm_Chr5g0048371 [Rosa chinensis]|uniref:Uncharacterized protein n=1 Tax=Rosa chinensis TaxID=74649 RepID=A0A2P6QEL3_ROSCH|nr:hypothetical protein RchiOBHm_Chr5g0048371 [Rosa chinensis]